MALCPFSIYLLDYSDVVLANGNLHLVSFFFFFIVACGFHVNSFFLTNNRLSLGTSSLAIIIITVKCFISAEDWAKKFGFFVVDDALLITATLSIGVLCLLTFKALAYYSSLSSIFFLLVDDLLHCCCCCIMYYETGLLYYLNCRQFILLSLTTT